jgi:hypothetical protein
VIYECLFAILPYFLLYRVGRNFFIDSFWFDKPLLDTNFYIPAALFILFWAAAFIMSYTRRLRRGLTMRIEKLARDLATVNAESSLFPELDQRCDDFFRHRERLKLFSTSVESIRQQYLVGQSAERLSVKN